MKHFIQVVADNKHCSNEQLENLAYDAGYEASSKIKKLWNDENNAEMQFSSIKLNITIEIEAD